MRYLEVMFEFERFIAFCTFEISEDGTFIMTDHVTLKTVDVGECFITYFTRLKQKETTMSVREIFGI